MNELETASDAWDVVRCLGMCTVGISEGEREEGEYVRKMPVGLGNYQRNNSLHVQEPQQHRDSQIDTWRREWWKSDSRRNANSTREMRLHLKEFPVRKAADFPAEIVGLKLRRQWVMYSNVLRKGCQPNSIIPQSYLSKGMVKYFPRWQKK